MMKYAFRLFIAVLFISILWGCSDSAGSDFSSRTWGKEERISEYNLYYYTSPAAVIDSAGNIMVTWYQTDMMAQTSKIAFNRYMKGEGWAVPRFVTEQNTGSVGEPLMGIDDEDVIMALWRWTFYDTSMTYHCFSSRFTDEFGWEIPEYADYHNGFDELSYLDFFMSPSGDAFAIWVQHVGAYEDVYANNYIKGQGWYTLAVPVESNASEYVYSPRIAMNANGDAVAAWHNYVSSRNSIWANVYAGGSWSTAAPLEADNSYNHKEPQVAIDPQGNALAVWYQDAAAMNLRAARYVKGTGWGSDLLIDTSGEDVVIADLAMDDEGNAMVVWTQKAGSAINLNARRCSKEGAWDSAVTIIATDTAGTAYNPSIAFDGNGNALAVWMQKDSAVYNIKAARYTRASGWSEPELAEFDDTADAKYPRLSMNSNGEAVIVWMHSDGYYYQVWVNTFE